MYRYEIKQIPGRNRRGIFVDGMLLAVIEDKRMHREAEFLITMADMENRYSQRILETMQRPMVFVVSEEERSLIEAKSEVRSDLNWDA